VGRRQTKLYCQWLLIVDSKIFAKRWTLDNFDWILRNGERLGQINKQIGSKAGIIAPIASFKDIWGHSLKLERHSAVKKPVQKAWVQVSLHPHQPIADWLHKLPIAQKISDRSRVESIYARFDGSFEEIRPKSKWSCCRAWVCRLLLTSSEVLKLVIIYNFVWFKWKKIRVRMRKVRRVRTAKPKNSKTRSPRNLSRNQNPRAKMAPRGKKRKVQKLQPRSKPNLKNCQICNLKSLRFLKLQCPQRMFWPT